MCWVCHMSVIQNKPNECVPKWNKNYLMQGLTKSWLKFVAVTGWRRCHFSLLFIMPLCRQTELHRLPTSTGTCPSLLPTLLLLPWHVTLLILHSIFFFPFPDWPLSPELCSPAEPLLPWSVVCSRWRTMGGKTLQAKRSDCGLTAKENGRHHQVLQADSFTLRRTLDQIKTGPPRILFPGETPHACWRHSFVKLYNILNDANRRQLWGVGTRKADTTLHLSLRWWESSGMVTTEKTSSEQSLQNCGLPCSLV